MNQSNIPTHMINIETNFDLLASKSCFNEQSDLIMKPDSPRTNTFSPLEGQLYTGGKNSAQCELFTKILQGYLSITLTKNEKPTVILVLTKITVG